MQARSRENGIWIVFVHPAEFLVTAPDGSIASRSLLGNQLLIRPEDVGTPIDVYNHGRMFRDFTYVEDLVRGIRLLIDAAPERPASREAVPEGDSLSPVASPGFKFSAGGDNGAGADLQRSIARIEQLPCDVLMSAHPTASGFMERVANRPANNPQGIKDDTQCRKYAQAARDALAARLAEEAR